MLNGLKAAALGTIAALALAACTVGPQPLTREEVNQAVRDDLAALTAKQEPVRKPLTLYEAMARTVLYNLDYRARLVEETLNQGQVDLAKFDMMPILGATGGYMVRDESNAAASRSYITQRQSLEPSFSTDRDRTFYDLRFSWNVLDFGVSYFQANQTADRFLITQIVRERLMQRMLQQVRVAYWRATAAQELRPQVIKTLDRARAALESLGKLGDERLQAPLETLQERRTLLEIVSQLEGLERSLSQAAIELNTLMNAPPGAPVQIAAQVDHLPKPPEPPKDLDALELVALQNSLDVKEQMYNARIERAESRKALLRLLPGLELGAAHQFDSNSFLTFNHWNELSSRLTWNILRVLTYPSVSALAETREKLAETKRLAMNMATLSRFQLSVRRYDDALNQWRRSQELNDVEQQMAKISATLEQAEAGSRAARIRNETSALRAKLRAFESFANAQDALGAVYVSLGLNPLPKDFQTQSVEDLSAAIAKAFSDWEAGRLPIPESDPRPATTTTTAAPTAPAAAAAGGVAAPVDPAAGIAAPIPAAAAADPAPAPKKRPRRVAADAPAVPTDAEAAPKPPREPKPKRERS